VEIAISKFRQVLVDVKSQRTALKKAFEIGIIENGHDWMDLILDRNLIARMTMNKKPMKWSF